MELELWRYRTNGEATLGILMERQSTTRAMLCFTCEDPRQTVKIRGETRIPAGTYEIKLRREGGMHKRYARRFGEHVGMLWLQNVPNFEWIYIHLGNDAQDTEGCILVGEQREESTLVVHKSAIAYARIYPRIAAAIRAERGARITVVNLDRPEWPLPPL